MLAYIARRLLLMIPTLIVSSMLIFTVINLPEGDYFETLAAEMQAQGVDVMAQMFERDEAGFTEDYDPNAAPGATAEVQPEQEEAQG